MNGIAVWFQSQARLEAEVLMLRHRVNVLAGSAAMMRPESIEAEQRLLSGSVRVTTSETFANLVIAPLLKEFREQHPSILVELISDDRRLDPIGGEADVALRAGSRPEGASIVARRLLHAAWSVY